MYLAQHCGGSDLHGDCLAAFRQVELGTIFTHPYGIYCEIEQVTVAVRRVVAALCDTLAPSLMIGAERTRRPQYAHYHAHWCRIEAAKLRSVELTSNVNAPSSLQ